MGVGGNTYWESYLNQPSQGFFPSPLLDSINFRDWKEPFRKNDWEKQLEQFVIFFRN